MLSPVEARERNGATYWHAPEAMPVNESGKGFWGEDGFTFGDFLDTINPLQHLPIVGTVYRALTGDELAPGARLAGGALFGGPIGAAAAMANLAVEEIAGQDIGATVLAAVTGDDTPATPTQVAALAPTAAATATDAVTAEGTRPQLSPAAFEALMRSVELSPQAAATLRPPATAATDAADLPELSPAAFEAPVGAGSTAPAKAANDGENQAEAARELHDMLRAYAEERGVTPPAGNR